MSNFRVLIYIQNCQCKFEKKSGFLSVNLKNVLNKQSPNENQAILLYFRTNEKHKGIPFISGYPQIFRIFQKNRISIFIYFFINVDFFQKTRYPQIFCVSRTPAQHKLRSNFLVVHLPQIFLIKTVVHLLHYNLLFIVHSLFLAVFYLKKEQKVRFQTNFQQKPPVPERQVWKNVTFFALST